MSVVTGVIHAFVYFVAWLDASPIIGGLLFVFIGIPIVAVHVLVWAIVRFFGPGWAFGAALAFNLLMSLIGIIWPMPVAGGIDKWMMNALVFIAIGIATMGVLIAYIHYAQRRFAARA